MRLFNKANLLKMIVPNSYELFMHKLGIHLFYKLGVVKLRGDRYVYEGQDVIKIDPFDNLIEIKLFDPVIVVDDDTNEEIISVKLSMTLYVMPGENCSEELHHIHDHIRRVNEFHIIFQAKSIQ